MRTLPYQIALAVAPTGATPAMAEQPWETLNLTLATEHIALDGD